METYTKTQTIKLFRRFDGMYLYACEVGGWGQKRLTIQSTNDAVEAAMSTNDYRFVKMIDRSEGEFIDAEVTITAKVPSDF